ncbi:hypothetical protein FSS13T_15800 [Flavobacterium saliperosum S13]|uniref:Uncharacterized protein n=2 Tax=Flavobacterium saliperosum TaxID=329186 RepID=A0A1G4VGQ0_9FLAO|nr:hypothetical protein [Flavobacterium saliperosum]ESU25347.1 hypothetical protein FSS13T_15800 [Flavobacterium saliperosum S13]SCX06548.1 hypothetical protein SAMN02927925_01020 [Flavobacterium saliperosum]
MKTIFSIAIGFMLLVFGSSMQAQVSLNVNVGEPPSWGPAGHTGVNYYYLPDIETYYDVPARQFIYYNRGTWVRTKYLPRAYRNYDLYGGYKVVLNDYRGKSPYAHFKNHKVKYHKGYKNGVQKTYGAKQNKQGNHGNQGKKNNHGGNGKKH